MYQIEDVFSPKSFPENTYVMRKSDEYETIDDRFRKALAMKGNLIFISGASKSGKTVCSSYVGEFELFSVRVCTLFAPYFVIKDGVRCK
jgi:Cdc6-like AAA superfamily ATPase